MAKDVEFNVTANDKTDKGLDSVARKVKAQQEKIRKQQDEENKKFSSRFLREVKKFSPALGKSISEGLESGAKVGAPAIGAAVAIASPVISGLVASAVVGGAGIGGVVGGFLLAARDVRVSSALEQLGDKVTGALEFDSSTFIAPALAAIDEVEQRFDALRPVFQSIFQNASHYVEPLVDSVLDFVEAVTRGADIAISRAGPVIKAISQGISDTGTTIEHVFDILSQNGVGAADTLRITFKAINDSLITTANFLNLINGIVQKLDEFRPDWVKDLFDPQQSVGQWVEANNQLSGSLQTITTDTRTYAEAEEEAKRAADDLINAQRSLYGATTSVAEATANASKTIRDNGKDVRLSTAAGRENRAALEQVANAMARVYDGTVQVNGVGLKSAKVATDNANKFVALAQKAGYSAGAARQLARDLGLIPSKKEVQIRAETADAEAKAKHVRDLLAQIRSKTVNVSVLVNESRRDKVADTLSRRGVDYAAGPGFAAAGVLGGGRTQAPTPVSVTSNVDVYLDGAPFRQYTARAIDQNTREQAFREKVGRR